ncbi:hypothetical protein AHAS_Ahas11G0194100 [Arachis hypogaea]
MNPDIMNTVHEDLRYLARGPSRYAKRFSTFSINGFSFRTTNRDNGLKTPNSGVFLMSSTPCVASASDSNVRNADLSYYDKLEDIIELKYNGQFRVTLFKCKWADTTRERGCRKDSWDFTFVIFSRVIHSGDREEDDPYIEASQARMVYFVNDEVNKDWSVVVHLKPRDSYDMGGNEDDEACEDEPWLEQNLDSLFENGDNLSLLRDEVDDEVLDDDIGEDEHISEYYAKAKEARFCFKVSDNLAKLFLLQSLGKEWREHRIKFWNDFYDPRLSKTEIINNAPKDIAPDQWALFVEYCLKPETQKLCKRNQEIRQKQIIPHTSGIGAVPTIAFKNNTTRISQMNLGSSNDAGTSSTCGPNVQEELDTVKEQLQALVSYIASKEGGQIPIQLAGMFPTQQVSQI